MGQTTIDLEYGAAKMPRVVLVDKHGKIVYIGHPKKLNIKEALETLVKEDTFILDPLLL